MAYGYTTAFQLSTDVTPPPLFGEVPNLRKPSILQGVAFKLTANRGPPNGVALRLPLSTARTRRWIGKPLNAAICRSDTREVQDKLQGGIVPVEKVSGDAFPRRHLQRTSKGGKKIFVGKLGPEWAEHGIGGFSAVVKAVANDGRVKVLAIAKAFSNEKSPYNFQGRTRSVLLL